MSDPKSLKESLAHLPLDQAKAWQFFLVGMGADFDLLIKAAHDKGLIQGDLSAIIQDASGIYGTAMAEAKVDRDLRSMRARLRPPNWGRHYPAWHSKLREITDEISDELRELEAIEGDVDYIGEIDDLTNLGTAIETRKAAIEAVKQLAMLLKDIQIGKNLPRANRTKWEQRRLARQFVSWWNEWHGSRCSDGEDALCYIYVELYHKIGWSVPKWSKDRPERDWAMSKLRKYLNSSDI